MSPHSHTYIHHFTLSKEHEYVLLIAAIRTFLFTAVSIFLPVYIYKIYNFELLILYLLLHYSIFALAAVSFLQHLINRMDLKTIQWYSLLLSILQLILIKFIDKHPVIVGLTALVGAFSLILQFVPTHIILALFGKRENIGERYALFNLVVTIISIITPFLSALIIKTIGFDNFFICVLLIGIILLAYLRKAYGKYKSHSISMSNVTTRFKQYSEFFPLFFSDGIKAGADFLVMLLIYIFTNNIIYYGIILTLISLVSSMSTFIIARFLDKKHDFAVGTIGYLLCSNIYVYLYFSLNSFGIFISNILLGLTRPLLVTPFIVLYYHLIRKYGAELTLYYEIVTAFAKGILFSSAYILDLKTLIALVIMVYIIAGIIYYRYAIKEELVIVFARH